MPEGCFAADNEVMTPRAPLGDDAERSTDDAELAQLRRRAYGPDADIASDPVAQARLRELESSRRAPEPSFASAPSAPSAPSASSAPSGLSAPSDVRAEGRMAVPPRPPLPPSREAPGNDSPPRAPRPSASGVARARPAVGAWSARLARWARSPRHLAIAAVGLLVVIALAVVPGLFAQRPDATLRVDPAHEDEAFIWQGGGANEYLRQLEIEAADIVRYEAYGDLNVWATPANQPQRCVFIFIDEDNIWALGCAPRGLDPIADVPIRPDDMSLNMRESLPDLPDGSTVRFTLRGDVVEVWIARADPVAAAE